MGLDSKWADDELPSKWQTSKKSEPLKSKWDSDDTVDSSLPLPSKWQTAHKDEPLKSKWADDDEEDVIAPKAHHSPVSKQSSSSHNGSKTKTVRHDPRSKDNHHKESKPRSKNHIESNAKPKSQSREVKPKANDSTYALSKAQEDSSQNDESDEPLQEMTDAGKQFAMRLGINFDNKPDNTAKINAERSSKPNKINQESKSNRLDARNRDQGERGNRGNRDNAHNRSNDRPQRDSRGEGNRSQRYRDDYNRLGKEKTRSNETTKNSRTTKLRVNEITERLDKTTISQQREEAKRKEEEARAYLESLESNLDWAEFDD